MYFLLSDGGSPRLVKKTEVELAIKPLHPTLIGNTFVNETKHPDIVIWSVKAKKVFVIELVVPYEDNVWWCRDILLGRSGLVVMMLRPRNHA